jgi:ABC-2 type transport system permease protein
VSALLARVAPAPLWRLEWLRIVRTRRWIAVLGVYGVFGLLGPVTARYLETIVESFGTDDVAVSLPDPTPADGLAQFVSNATQIGLIVVVVAAAGALAVDQRPEMGVFLRTRVARAATLLWPRFAAAAALAVAGWLLGVAAAWYETVVLLGSPPVGGVLAGAAFGALYLVFAVAVTALAAAVVRTTVGAAVGALVGLLALGLLSIVPAAGAWLPGSLLGSLAALADGAAIGDYVPAAAVTVALTAGALAAAAALLDRRER